MPGNVPGIMQRVLCGRPAQAGGVGFALPQQFHIDTPTRTRRPVREPPPPRQGIVHLQPRVRRYQVHATPFRRRRAHHLDPDENPATFTHPLVQGRNSPARHRPPPAPGAGEAPTVSRSPPEPPPFFRPPRSNTFSSPCCSGDALQAPGPAGCSLLCRLAREGCPPQGKRRAASRRDVGKGKEWFGAPPRRRTG